MFKVFEKVLSWTLIGALTVQPALLHAQSITVVGPDNGPRPRVDQSYNGTPVLNIGTPNGAGVSHDIYTEFTANDLILNNSATNVDTQLGGWIEGNPNLTPGNVADLWIGEVIGGNQTQLNGILEVGGQSMDVILANEFGITCNGCGFINTGRTTLTTGTPRFGADGALAGFDVKQGTVTIGAGGLNPQDQLSLADTSRVDVIARAAQIYGAMRADQINVVAGANVVDYDWSYNTETGEITGVTEQAGTGAAPALAVDVSALGGMYANAITMVATENGVGVRLDGEMASSSDIAIRADGRLTLGAPAGAHVPQIKARERVIVRNQGPLVLEGSVTSENGNLIDIRTTDGSLTFSGQADGGAISLESAGLANITALISAADALSVTSTADAVVLGNGSEITANTIDVTAATTVDLNGKATATGDAVVTAGTVLTLGDDAELSAQNMTLIGAQVTVSGVATATDALAVEAGTDGLINSGTLSGATVALASDGDIGNTGTVSAGTSLTLTTDGTVTNAATLISGDEMSIYADQILNNGGVIWANDSITLAANAGLDRASLVQNTNGRIEAFQGDLTIRGDEVANLGTAPTIGASEIIKWVEQGSSGPVAPVDELSKLIDPAYLDADDNILPAYAAQYAALWADVVSGGSSLSADAQSILKPTVLSPSGTAIKDDFIGLWDEMNGKANASGTPDPAALVVSMVDPAIFDVDGKVLPAHAEAYAALWSTLASGSTSVSDAVKDILDPATLIVESTETDAVTGVVTTFYSNDLTSNNTDVWAAMSAGSGASYDIVKILYQDRFNDDGKLAELVAGGSVDIEADEVRNIFSNVSAGEDIMITANEVTNQAIGATQVLLEVHKKPGCFTCHEGEVDFYDTFGGRIEAVGNLQLMGSLSNVTVNSSEMSLQDVMDTMNSYIAEQKAAGDADLAGVSVVQSNNLEFHGDHREDDYTAPVDGVAETDREVIPVDTGDQTPVEVATTATPTLTPTETVDALLAAGLNTIAEQNPEFTDYANFITSNYMMDVDRLQYRDDLIKNTMVSGATRGGISDAVLGEFDLSYLDQPIQVPSPDGSGLTTIHPATSSFELDTRGAVISGNTVTISGTDIDNSGAILASSNVSVTGLNSITGSGGSIVSDAGTIALTALGSIAFEDTQIDGAKIDIIAGQDFVGKGVAISSDTDTSIYAATGVTLTALEKEYEITRTREVPIFLGGRDATGAIATRTEIVDTTTVTDQKLSTLDVGGNLSIVSSADMVLAGLGADIVGNTTLTATGNLELTEVQSRYEYHGGNSKNGTDIENVTSHVTTLNTGGDFVATAGEKAILVGTEIDAGGSVQLAAAEGVVLAAAQNIAFMETRRSKSGFLSKKQYTDSYTSVTNDGVRIAAAGTVDVIAETGDLLSAGAAFASNNGDINLSATEGDIYAGAYEDIFQETHKKSKSFFFGLINSSSELNTVDKFSTGTEALAELDLSLVSGEDTTLVGANLSAGRNLNINTGGDFSVEAAINSQRSQFFSTNAGLVTMTTIQETSFVETAVFTQLLAGQGINFGIGGEATLAMYEQAGVDLPSLEDLYPEELLVIEGLKLLESQELANEYFYDKQTTLSPAFKALVAIALSFTGVGAAIGQGLLSSIGITSGFTTTAAGILKATSALAKAATAFSSSVLISTADAAVSGDFDLGDILGDAFKSGLTAGITAGISDKLLGAPEYTDAGKAVLDEAGKQVVSEGLLTDFISGLPDGALLGFGEGNLSIQGIVRGTVGNVVSAGVNSAVYGTDFSDALTSSTISTIVNLTLADTQNVIGDLGLKEGSFQHALLHGIAGCAAAEAQGADCAAGAAGGIAASVYSGTLDGNAAFDPETAMANAQMIAAVASYFASGGKSENVSVGANIGQSAVENNYLKHTDLAEFTAMLQACREKADGCSRAEEHSIMLQMGERGLLNDVALSRSCFTQTCIDEFLANAATFDDVAAIFGSAGYWSSGHLIADASKVRDQAWDQLSWNLDYAQGFKDYQTTKCQGQDAATCLSGYNVAYRDYVADIQSVKTFQTRFAVATTLGFGAVAIAPRAMAAMEACVLNPSCLTALPGVAGELGLGAAGATAGQTFFTVGVGGFAGRVVMKHGDEIISVIDDAGRIFKPVTQLPDDAGRILLQNADGITGHLNGSGVFVRTLEEIMPSSGRVPTSRRAFDEWASGLSSEELQVLWANNGHKTAFTNMIREGGRHEWCMCDHFPTFSKWGLDLDEVRALSTATDELRWIVPNDVSKIGGQAGGHISSPGNAPFTGSTTFHNELSTIIENSSDMAQFRTQLPRLLERWKIEPSLLPEGLR